MSKIVITGTGRCGTSFLMHFFTELGLNTGYNIDECEWHLERSGCNGGIEHTSESDKFEYSDIVKNPVWMYNPELLNFDIKSIIVPVRNLEDVAKSRANMGSGMYGGFWNGATNIEEQMQVDAKAFYNFINYTIKQNLKVIFLDFPRIVNDSEYLFDKIGYKIGVCTKPWKSSFEKIANIDKVHV